MNTLNFNIVFLGQSVLKYEVPLDIFKTINHVYETKKHELPPANVQLVGKIKNEHSLFFDGKPNNKMNPHNYLTLNVLQWFKKTSIEYSAADKPMNGQLQILGNSSGQFANVDYGPVMKERDFYVFPYDMRHCVYPFNSTNETRRTLACNMDVDYNPIINRSVT
jgi:hypothetical protein